MCVHIRTAVAGIIIIMVILIAFIVGKIMHPFAHAPNSIYSLIRDTIHATALIATAKSHPSFPPCLSTKFQ